MTLKSDVPISLKKMDVKCTLSKIVFQLPADQVPDWDDRMRTVKWVDAPRNTPGNLTTKRKVSIWGTGSTNLTQPTMLGCLLLSIAVSRCGKQERSAFDFSFRNGRLNLHTLPNNTPCLSWQFSFSLHNGCSKSFHLFLQKCHC